MNISELKGIGDKTEKVFIKAGIKTTDDLLKYYPRNYDIFEAPVPVNDLECEKVFAVRGTVAKNPEVKRVRNLQILNVFIADDRRNVVKATWFNMPYLKNQLKVESTYVFRGKVKENRGMFILEQPKIYEVHEYALKLEQMQPIYPLVYGLTNNMVIKAMEQALAIHNNIEEYMPKSIIDSENLLDLNEAIHKIHFPQNKSELHNARKRMVFNEFFDFVYALRRFRESDKTRTNEYKLNIPMEIDRLIDSLPYKLTDAQIRTWKEIKEDISSEKLMNRLVQGDVGSGKTIVAILLLLTAAFNGCQGAIMVPTEVLARQHYENICNIISENNLDITTVLLTGSMKAKEKREALAKIESGEGKIIVGTHALIQENVVYDKLAVVITDEQHRFGVRQREAISFKGIKPHVLVMSATPIPRTLAIIMYGDLDISIIDELPANRLPIKNCVVGTGYRPNAYKFMMQQINEGRQVYIICPTVEYSEAVEGENVIEYSEKLKGIFPPSVSIEYLHGKMKPSEKNEIMERFASNEIQILVSTTVVEVGVNVPNATVMMVENAERFGLAGLHQLRGRVGRGKHQSYCIFINGNETKKSKERLDILVSSNDGFKIAGEDLKLRGPGDFFGVRQSGDMEFKLADIYSDTTVLKKVAEIITNIEEGNIKLTEEEIKKLNIAADKCISPEGNGINI